MKEAFGVSGEIKSIVFQDLVVLLEFRGDLAFLLITEKITEHAKRVLKQFTTTFTTVHADLLHTDEIPQTQIEDATIIRNVLGLD